MGPFIKKIPMLWSEQTINDDMVPKQNEYNAFGMGFFLGIFILLSMITCFKIICEQCYKVPTNTTPFKKQLFNVIDDDTDNSDDTDNDVLDQNHDIDDNHNNDNEQEEEESSDTETEQLV